MESFIDRYGFVVGGGNIKKLPPNPGNFQVDRTVLIRVGEPAPRGLFGQIARFDTVLSNAEILTQFGTNGSHWDSLPNHRQPDTELCLDVSRTGRVAGALLAFQLRHPQHPDTFIHHQGTPDYAVMGIEGEEGIYEPTWVDAGFKTVKVLVAPPVFDINYILGINVAGSGGRRPTPMFVDPKIENNG